MAVKTNNVLGNELELLCHLRIEKIKCRDQIIRHLYNISTKIPSRNIIAKFAYVFLAFSYLNVDKSRVFFFTRNRQDINILGGQNQSVIFYYCKYHDLRAHPLKAINNISVGGQVGVFPQLLRLS